MNYAKNNWRLPLLATLLILPGCTTVAPVCPLPPAPPAPAVVEQNFPERIRRLLSGSDTTPSKSSLSFGPVKLGSEAPTKP